MYAKWYKLSIGECHISKFNPQPSFEGPRINERIRVEKIRLIDENGEMVGVVTTREGLERAQACGLDLIEVSPNAEPPVCKILDFGKYKYEAQKKKQEAKKNQKIIEIKEIKMKLAIAENDYQIKLKNIKKFIEDEDKVKVSMRLRGREMAHRDKGLLLFQRIEKDMENLGKVESYARFEGQQIIMMLGPIKT